MGDGLSEQGCFIGMDEAGYGPNLGPLLITVTKWRTPECPTQCEFYKALQPVVSANNHFEGKRLHLADSKVVFTGKDGFASLERSALALLGCVGEEIDSFQKLWSCLTRHAMSAVPEKLPPWYHADISLPVAASREQVRDLTGRLQQRLQQAGLHLAEIHSDVVIEPRFNRLTLADGSNKSLALTRLAFALLRRAWCPDAPGRTLFVGDKHGGRNRYDELLSEFLDGHLIFRMEEGQTLSRYRVGGTELRFQVQGEQHLPVACASIISKYVRELAMDLFNAYWAQHCPELKPTRGYPNDAKRFRAAIEPMRLQLGIEEHVLWRER
ncbi:hypothetical protein [Planctomicrobium piriforme]|nr:hypothetical protein [Planctomicrobium piriforme]